MTNKFQETADRFPDDGGAQVTHVHLLGNVGGGEIDDDTQSSRDGRRTNSVHQDVGDEFRDEGRAEGDIDETRPGYFTLMEHAQREREREREIVEEVCGMYREGYNEHVIVT